MNNHSDLINYNIVVSCNGPYSLLVCASATWLAIRSTYVSSEKTLMECSFHYYACYMYVVFMIMWHAETKTLLH